jgi:hypothetical protein
MLTSDLTECITATLTDAQDANTSVLALLELLRGCPPNYPLSAGLFLGLMVSVQSHLENVVDGLRVVNGKPLQLMTSDAALTASMH